MKVNARTLLPKSRARQRLGGRISRRAIEWLCIITIAGLGIGYFISEFMPSTGDDLNGCVFRLASDKSHYSIGETIRFTFTITPTKDKSVGFFEQMQNTVTLHPLQKEPEPGKHPEDLGSTRRFKLRPDAPLTVQITGSVKPCETPGSLMVDCGLYGRVLVRTNLPVAFSARARPAEVGSAESGEWPFSNSIFLTFAE
jgi:hypothetical protein